MAGAKCQAPGIIGLAIEIAPTRTRSLPSQAQSDRVEVGLEGIAHAGQVGLQGGGEDLLLVGAHLLAEAADLALAEMEAFLVGLSLLRSIPVDHRLQTRI